MTGLPLASSGQLSVDGLPLPPGWKVTGPWEAPETLRAPKSISSDRRSVTEALRSGAGGLISAWRPANWWNDDFLLARWTGHVMATTPGEERSTSPTGTSRPSTVAYSKMRKRTPCGFTRPSAALYGDTVVPGASPSGP